ncbi:MAG TPA: SpoIIE family protein phosphatase [Bryobacteraceae bacterium]|nr:SpoIIE family protein phosphatase [Bryobacteraceae bacterium]
METVRRGLARLGRLEWAFIIFTLSFLVAYNVGVTLITSILGIVGIGLGIALAIRLARRGMKKAIWRLRNRLIAAYLFIAVVPVVLITALLGLAGYAVIEQMSIYLVNRELDHRETSLLRQAEASAHFPMRDQENAINRFRMTMRNVFPDAHILVTGREQLRYPQDSELTHPPQAWTQYERATGAEHSSGLVIKDGKLFVWAHVLAADNEVTVLAPLTPEMLGGFVPGLGDATFRPIMGHARESHLPPAVNPFDFRVNGLYPVLAPHWNSPKKQERLYLWVDTRLSSVMSIVFGQKLEWGEAVLDGLIVCAVLFFIVELASLIAGVQLSRSITGAVYELYEGTQHVKEGDFGYRVPVKGSDQLADLTSSFNTMTENLSKLIVVAKEKERLESELEIAREVQSNLFPKNAPLAKNLELRGLCQPARVVSGDYYDFMVMPHMLGFAIGDVAGKGISAALLMATIQSTMRTQLTPTNGSGPALSTANLVEALNRQLYATTSPEKYATFFLGLFDEDTSALMYTNAGHLSPMLLRGSHVQELEPTGTVVGAFAVARYEEQTVQMEPGDVLVAYTDGIVEPENEYDEMFGEQRLQDLLVKFENTGSDELIARTLEAVRQWAHSPEQQDDMTMIVARRL